MLYFILYLQQDNLQEVSVKQQSAVPNFTAIQNLNYTPLKSIMKENFSK